MKNIGLVLEGGGMRGIYTCGVLEYFLDNDIFFNYVIGVSAGACNAVSYISRQKGRNEKVIIDYVGDWRYLSVRNFILNKSMFGMDFIFDEIPNKHVLFDFEEFDKANCNFLIGATDCNTGKSVYLSKSDIGEKFEALRASSSLPLVSPIVRYKGFELLDGGISDSIPIKKSIQDGNEKNVIVLTRNHGYRKEPAKHIGIFKRIYRNYPRLIEAIENRYKNYNDTLDYIERLEEEGKAFVIRPSQKIEVGRMEKNPERLRKLLKNGYDDINENSQELDKFLG